MKKTNEEESNNGALHQQAGMMEAGTGEIANRTSKVKI
ncbi:hypothetical protein NBRC111894_2554 [Sporolactobacillus inulinus]|uniref:Uncharacterized protein n=1 Tax=Sporolactobacillus inulinus TaxID=2078 RepID=A0A4Y1ZDF2_9BACL|nr:hypothetical protein NBRC111894_2554 [Sporolactobacillus inulinus]